MGLHRNMVGHFVDPEWESWPKLSRKHLIRTGMPSKLMLTVFGRDVDMPHQAVIHPDERRMEAENQPPAKKHKMNPDQGTLSQDRDNPTIEETEDNTPSLKEDDIESSWTQIHEIVSGKS